MNKNIKIIKAHNNSITVEYDSKNYHSKYNPESEAKKIIGNRKLKDNVCYIILGSGLGYIVNALLQKNVKKIISFEYLSELEKNKVYQENKVLSFFGEDDEQVILERFFSYIEDDINIEFQIIKNTNVIKFNTEYYKKIIDIIEKFFSYFLLNKKTLYDFGLSWTENSFKSLELINRGNNIKGLFKSLTGKKAILVSAGKSLDNKIELLKKYQDKFIIFSTDTAASALFENNIDVDFIGVFDSQNINLQSVYDYTDTNACFILSGFLPYEFQKKIKNRIYADINDNVMKYFFKNRIGSLLSGGSVACVLLDIIKKSGIKEIYLFGQDFCFLNGIPYSKLTKRYNLFFSDLNKYISIENVIKNNYNLIKKDDKETIDNLINYKKWFEFLLKDDTDFKIYNLSEGLDIKNTKKINNNEFIKLAQNSDIIEKKFDFMKIDIDNLSERKQEFQLKIKKIINTIDEINKYKDFYSILKQNKISKALINVYYYFSLHSQMVSKEESKQKLKNFLKRIAE